MIYEYPRLKEPMRTDRPACLDFFQKRYGEGNRMKGSPLFQHVRWLIWIRNFNRVAYWRIHLSNRERARIACEEMDEEEANNLNSRAEDVFYPDMPYASSLPRGRRPYPTNKASMRKWLERRYFAGSMSLGSPYLQFVLDRILLDPEEFDVRLLDHLAKSEALRVRRLHKISSASCSTATIYYDEYYLQHGSLEPLMPRGRRRGAKNKLPKISSEEAERIRAASTYLHKLRTHVQEGTYRLTQRPLIAC